MREKFKLWTTNCNACFLKKYSFNKSLWISFCELKTVLLWISSLRFCITFISNSFCHMKWNEVSKHMLISLRKLLLVRLHHHQCPGWLLVVLFPWVTLGALGYGKVQEAFVVFDSKIIIIITKTQKPQKTELVSSCCK